MKPISGVNKDTSPIDQPQNTYKHAKNIVLSRKSLAVSPEEGLKMFEKKNGYKHIFTLPVKNEQFVVFHKNETHSTISIYGQDGGERLIIESQYLNFSEDSPTKATFYYNHEGDLVIVWTDGVNPPRILNLNNIGFNPESHTEEDISKLDLFVKAEIPDIIVETLAKIPGNISIGAYSFFITYEIDEYSETNFFGGYGSYLIGEGYEIDSNGKESIQLTFKDLDTKYSYFNLYVIRNTNGTKTAHKLAKLPTSAENVTHVWTGATLDSLAVEEVLLDESFINTAKTLTVVGNRLYLANLTIKQPFDYQPYANNIKVKWALKAENQLGSPEKSSNDYGLKGVFMPGATYAFYIAWHLKSGQTTSAFHIPGIEVPEAYKDKISNSIGNDFSRLLDVNDYSEVTDSEVVNIGKIFNTTINILSLRGNMSPTQNETEVYPDSERWDVKDHSGLIGTLRNSNVRHHKFPTVQFLERYHKEHDTSGIDEILYNPGMNPKLGVELENIFVPKELQNEVTGYTVYYSERDFNNMDLVTYTPLYTNAVNANVEDQTAKAQEAVDTDWSEWVADNGDNSEIYAAGEYKGWILKIRFKFLSGGGNTSVYGAFFNMDNNIPYTWGNSEGIPLNSLHYLGIVPNDGICNEGEWYTAYVAAKDLDSGLFTYGSNGKYVGGLNDATRVEILEVVDNPNVLSENLVENEDNLRIYDPLLLAKKPKLSNIYIMPEYFGGRSTVSDVAGVQSMEESASSLFELNYAPANNAAMSNMEREECIFLKNGKALMPGNTMPYKDDIGVGTLVGSIRQYIPNIYFPFDSMKLVSTSRVKRISDHSLTFYPTGMMLGESSGVIYGGDCSVEEYTFKFMSLYGPSMEVEEEIPDDATEAERVIEFTENDYFRYMRKATYRFICRLPVSKFGEDLALKPVPRILEYYGGEYLNQYLYNNAFESLNTWKPVYPANESYKDNSVFKHRVARSVVRQSESSEFAWRKFRALDYYEHERTKGAIINIEEYGGELIIHTEHSIFKTIGKEQLDGDSIGIYLGTGDIFKLSPTEVIPTESGYAGTQHMLSCIKTKAGYFFVDESQGKAFLLGQQLNEITAKGMRNWFMEHLPFTIRKQLEKKNVYQFYSQKENPFIEFGSGFSAVFDDKYNRLLVSKKAYKIADESLIASGRYYDKNGNINTSGAYENDDEVNPDDPNQMAPGSFNGKIFVVDGELKVFQNDEYFPITDYPDYLEEDSWTWSFYPGRDAWVSEHSYVMDAAWSTRNRVWSVKNGRMFLHNANDNGRYYNLIPEESYIDVAFNPIPKASKVFYGFNWITEAINANGGSNLKETFTKALVYNAYQASGIIDLVEFTNIRLAEGTWNFNQFRDLVGFPGEPIMLNDNDFNDAALDLNKPWHTKKRFVDKYVILRLIFDNISKNTLFLYQVDTAFRTSSR